ncbi:LysR substrate-binding domain-containing protein [Phyllobacterium zundukense]|uniref:LysR family transcriptional regulator n=1 Tax=Phyllobacterium zundukense TaxID=1867719 RepID=A0A2N9W1E4_9HYPH|nr:LysR substrate-binding domain-containing protein [Phyllobacterium zundukense]ATU91663.1 LysR family transcriptional regulator [Phyllobacterium zundukense]PIO45562.1 LysR family transcriptional regulator [Phyllobacterium zundukense]
MTGSDIPPLTALRAFEATARLSSFKAAAAELFVTPTAISHQIRQLEEYLGVRVLDRTPRNVSLTPKGKELYEATVSGFGEIRRSVARLREVENSKALTLSATTAFLSHWLVPRLAEIRRILPELDLHLHASETIVKLHPGEIDMAIRYGKGPFAGVEATPLKIDTFAPVCSPRLDITDLEDIRRVELIHVDGRTAPLPLPDWPRWCSEAAISGVNTTVGLRFSNSMHAMQAAIAGQGVAIVSLVLATDALASGLLVQPFRQTLSGDIYHFACAPGIGTRTDIETLREWFRQELNVPPLLGP